jgi:hypothetical protein
LFDGGHQTQRHAPRQPETKLLLVLGVQAQQQAVLALVVVHGQLVNVHALILGNIASWTFP